MTTTHYTEADLLETYYMQPGASMPIMMHLAGCSDCAARYERLDRKLREAASCETERPTTFWSRQRHAILRKVAALEPAPPRVAVRRPLRVAAAVVLAMTLGSTIAWKTLHVAAPAAQPTRHAALAASPSANVELEISHDAWQSDELQDFHSVVQWETWNEEKETTRR